MTKYYYRYEDPYSFTLPEKRSPFFKREQEPDHPTLELCRVLRETPKGAVINTWQGEKFVNNSWHKRFAYPTLAEARESYRARKQREQHILTRRLQKVEYFITLDFAPEDEKRVAQCDEL